MHETHPVDVVIPVDRVVLRGILTVPSQAEGVVAFAHGSGSSRLSPRNQQVAHELHEAGFATLLFDLLNQDEAAVDDRTREYRFDIPRLGARLVAATDWLRAEETTRSLPIGYFGASTGAAAALVAAAERQDEVGAVVSRGGRPDLAGAALSLVTAPVLLIVGGLDAPLIGVNETAQDRLRGSSELVIVEGATHLFKEPGTIDEVTRHAIAWFDRHLR
ncbi:MAG TPA: alpha/beta family hydrolase [Thermomicrobiales bacterium]|nr:alpha/beta family hydrolase [Thermomicrobiales bacterium]